MKTIYVGNVPFTMTETQLRETFEVHGTVHSAKLITDRESGRPRGFGFVEMDDEPAMAAIKALNEADFGGRPLRVNEAQAKPEKKERSDRPARQPPRRR